MVERKESSRFHGFSEGFDAERFADEDFKIRSGMCPNCPDTLLGQDDDGVQRCDKCGFWTNCKAELEPV